MSKFASSKLQKVDLGDNEWVEIPSEISFGQMQAFLDVKQNEDAVGNTIDLLASFIKSWNLTDEEGQLMPVIKENISLLKFDVINTISEAIGHLVPDYDKKKGEKK